MRPPIRPISNLTKCPFYCGSPGTFGRTDGWSCCGRFQFLYVVLLALELLFISFHFWRVIKLVNRMAKKSMAFMLNAAKVRLSMLRYIFIHSFCKQISRVHLDVSPAYSAPMLKIVYKTFINKKNPTKTKFKYKIRKASCKTCRI